jgi:hypothetical protein
MKFPSIRQTVEQSPTIQDLIECVEILTGRRRNREIDYGTIDGTPTETLDLVALCSMGKVKARAYLGTATYIDASGWSKTPIDTVSYDTLGIIDVANSRMVPTKPGYYIVSGNIAVTSLPDTKMIVSGLRKNGVEVSLGSGSSEGKTTNPRSSVSDTIYMNGTTDYLELWGYNENSSAHAYTIKSCQNYLSIIGPF